MKKEEQKNNCFIEENGETKEKVLCEYSITAVDITRRLETELESLHYVYAFWLEGSFAMGTEDEYSDLDYWVDVEDEYVEEMLAHVEQALSSMGELDEMDRRASEHPKLGQVVYHIKGSSPYLVLDFNWQMHSRDKDEYHYIEGDIVEGAKVIFDRSNVIRFEPMNCETVEENKKNCRIECDYRYSQHGRVEKYILRKTFPEAYAYYNKYVIEPLVILLRLKYTPLYPYHYLLHISQHMPNEVITRLNHMLQINSFDEMCSCMKEAEEWYHQLVIELYE